MLRASSGWVVLSALAVVVVGALIWKKTKRVYVKVGRVSKLFLYPVKSLKGVEVSEGKCTKLGFEVDGLLDRSYMLVNEDKKLLSQEQCPTLALLSVKIVGKQLIISGPDIDPLTIDIKSSYDPNDKIIECIMDGDLISVVDCEEKPAKWFQHYLKKPNVRLVRFFPEHLKRKYIRNNPFIKQLRNKYTISLQNDSAFHILSQPSIDDLNKKIGDKRVSVYNFRPNILVEECTPYAEDSWKYMKFNNEVEMINVLPVPRCLTTTIDQNTGILTQKEPLITMRKYRIPKDPELVQKVGSIPCLGTANFVLKTGQIKIHDDVYAIVTKPFNTRQKQFFF